VIMFIMAVLYIHACTYHLIINEFFFPRHDVVIYVVGISPRVVKVGKGLVNQLLNDRLVNIELVSVE